MLVEAENLAGPVGYDDDDKLRTIRQSSKKKEKLAATPFLPTPPTHPPPFLNPAQNIQSGKRE